MTFKTLAAILLILTTHGCSLYVSNGLRHHGIWFHPLFFQPSDEEPPNIPVSKPALSSSVVNVQIQGQWGNYLDYIHYSVLPRNITDYADNPNYDFYKLPGGVTFTNGQLVLDIGYYGRIHVLDVCNLEPEIVFIHAAASPGLTKINGQWKIIPAHLSKAISRGPGSDDTCVVGGWGDILNSLLNNAFDTYTSKLLDGAPTLPVEEKVFDLENRIQHGSPLDQPYCFDLNPTALGAGLVTGDSDSYSVAATLIVKPSITIGSGQCSPLDPPQLESTVPQPGAPFKVQMAGEVSWRLVNDQMKRALKGKKFTLWGAEVTIDDVETRGTHGWLVVRMKVSGALQGYLIGWMIPNVDISQHQIKVEQFDLSPQTYEAFQEWDEQLGPIVAASIKDFMNSFAVDYEPEMDRWTKIASRTSRIEDQHHQLVASITTAIAEFSPTYIYADDNSLEVGAFGQGQATAQIVKDLSPDKIDYPKAEVFEYPGFWGESPHNFEIFKEMSTFYDGNKNMISSIQTFRPDDRWTVFYDHEEMKGNQLWIKGSVDVCDLTAIPRELWDGYDDFGDPIWLTDDWNGAIESVSLSDTGPPDQYRWRTVIDYQPSGCD